MSDRVKWTLYLRPKDKDQLYRWADTLGVSPQEFVGMALVTGGRFLVGEVNSEVGVGLEMARDVAEIGGPKALALIAKRIYGPDALQDLVWPWIGEEE